MRAVKEVTYYPGVLGLRAKIVSDADDSCRLFSGCARKINSG